ncbi:MAG: hypothetical protein U0798_15155 [Gemmataceae bacterium]
MQTRRFTYKDLAPAFAPEVAVKQTIRLPVGAQFKAGQVLGPMYGPAGNDVKTITIAGNPTGGTWIASLAGQSTDPIPHNASNAVVQAALEGLFGKGNVAVTGGPGPATPWVVTFQGTLAKVRVMPLTLTHSFTGGAAPTIGCNETTQGSAGAGQFDVVEGMIIPKATCVLAADYIGDAVGGVITERGGTGAPFSASAYFSGFFNVADLIGLTEAAANDLGTMAFGTTFDAPGGVLKLH